MSQYRGRLLSVWWTQGSTGQLKSTEIREMTDLTGWKTEVLLVLIGQDPLPCYIATQLLTNKGALVYLLHTGGGHSTLKVAERLRDQLLKDRADLKMRILEIDVSDGAKIAGRVRALLAKLPGRPSVGLHYSGGSKPMAVYSYAALSEVYPGCICGYVEPESLQLVLQKAGRPLQSIPIAQALEVNVRTLLAIQGYSESETGEPSVPETLVASLLEVSRLDSGRRQWRQWLRSLRPNSDVLPTVSEYPALKPVIAALAELTSGPTTSQAVAEHLGCEGGALRSCLKLFQKDWFVAYSWRALQVCDLQFSSSNLAANVNLGTVAGREVRLDVLAMSGCRPYVVAGYPWSDPNGAKQFLLDTCAHARRVGGDAVRIALVSLLKRPQQLEEEMAGVGLGPTRASVFGAPDVLQLSAHLSGWIKKTSFR